MNDHTIEPRGERLLAALCHLSGIFPLYGLFFCSIVWAVVRRTRPSVAFQALQALISQVLFHVLLLVPLLGVLIAWLLRLIWAPMVSALVAMNYVFTDVLFVVAWIVFAYAAFRVVDSGEFEYPFIGDRLRQEEHTTEMES